MFIALVKQEIWWAWISDWIKDLKLSSFNLPTQMKKNLEENHVFFDKRPKTIFTFPLAFHSGKLSQAIKNSFPEREMIFCWESYTSGSVTLTSFPLLICTKWIKILEM